MPTGLPNKAILTISAIPMSSIATAKSGVAVRRTSWGEGISRSSRGGDRLEPAPGDARGRLDGHAARPLSEDGLDGAVEQRAAAAGRERHDDRPRARGAGLLDDRASGLPGADLLDVAGDAAAA